MSTITSESTMLRAAIAARRDAFDEILDRYAATSGADLTDVAWYEAFAHFKFAVIAQGVQARAKAGAMGGQDFGDLDDEILHLGRSGLALL